jgi:hypothetical protein
VSSEPRDRPGESDSAGPGGSGQSSEEQLRAAYEAELSRITSSDMMLQAAVSLLNIGGRRLGPIGTAPAGAPAGAERDLEQVRDAIDAVRALLVILERRIPDELRPLRDALSQLQIAYARVAQAGPGTPETAGGERAPETPASAGARGKPGGEPADAPGARSGRTGQQEEGSGDGQSGSPGPAESSGRLWIPGR